MDRPAETPPPPPAYRTNGETVTVQPGIESSHQTKSNVSHTINNEQSKFNSVIATNDPTPTSTQLGQEGIITGNCPNCRIGNLEEVWNLWTYCCVPVECWCCAGISEKQCNYCGATYPS